MQYNFSYTTTAPSGAEIEVTLLITATLDIANNGSYDISAVSGTWHGQTVTGLTDPGTFYGNNNLFYPADNSADSNDGVGYSSFAGFAFTVDSSATTAADGIPIAGDDGSGNVLFYSGGQAGGVGDVEYIDGGTPVTNEALTPACYCAGTLIRTPGGDVAVEALREGDLVTTLDGKPQAILWVGRRSYAGRFLSANRALYPVRIKASALSNGVPSRDLLISAKHAMYLDGLLVAASDLVNGDSVVTECRMPRVDYFHIELAEHGVVWAENAPSETFVDDGSRGIFHNASAYAGPAAVGEAAYCAPRVTYGHALEAIRLRIVQRTTARAA